MRFSERNMSSVFFVARVNNSGEVVQLDISRITTMTEDEAENITLQAIELSENSGKISGFKYTSMNDGIGKVYVFGCFLSDLFRAYCFVFVCAYRFDMLGIDVNSGNFSVKKAIKPIAENIERQKQFVTDAGHEIKTPLAIILANTDALELHNGENKWSKNIRAQTIRLSGLMQNLLTLAKIDESDINATKESFSLNEIIDRTSDMFQEMLIPKNLILQKYYSADVIICANKELITRKGGGYGIGLSAARSIAEIHGGSIKASYGNDNTIIFTVIKFAV